MTLAYVGLSKTAVALAAASKSSGGSSTFLVLILFIAAMYFLWLRPQRRKLQQRQQGLIRAFEVGDEVVTQSGIIGTIVGLDDDRAEIQVSTGVVLTVVRAAIGRRIEPVVEEAYDSSTEPDDYEGSEDPEEDPPARRSRFWNRRNGGDDL